MTAATAGAAGHLAGFRRTGNAARARSDRPPTITWR